MINIQVWNKSSRLKYVEFVIFQEIMMDLPVGYHYILAICYIIVIEDVFVCLNLSYNEYNLWFRVGHDSKEIFVYDIEIQIGLVSLCSYFFIIDTKSKIMPFFNSGLFNRLVHGV